MLFKVRLIEKHTEFNVYATKDVGKDIMFLVYFEKEGWTWTDSCFFVPVN